MAELRQQAVGPGTVDMEQKAILYILHMGCNGSGACRRCSIAGVVEVVDSRADCSTHCTLLVAAASGSAGYMSAVYCHGASPALPADDGRSSCRRGRMIQTVSDFRGGLGVVELPGARRELARPEDVRWQGNDRA